MSKAARTAGSLTIAALGLLVLPAGAAAEAQRGAYTYFSADSCASAGKASKDICANAATNAAAEFEEKAPRFPTRAACEQAYRQGACSVSLRQSASGGGGKGGVSFTPRQQGFRLVIRSDNDMTTLPLAPGLEFQTRTAVRLSRSIDPRAAGAAAPRAAPVAGAAGQVFGSSSPNGEKGALPPPIPVDPNFDCSAYLEPGSKGDPNTGCAPAPNWRH